MLYIPFEKGGKDVRASDSHKLSNLQSFTRSNNPSQPRLAIGSRSCSSLWNCPDSRCLYRQVSPAVLSHGDLCHRRGNFFFILTVLYFLKSIGLFFKKNGDRSLHAAVRKSNAK